MTTKPRFGLLDVFPMMGQAIYGPHCYSLLAEQYGVTDTNVLEALLLKDKPISLALESVSRRACARTDEEIEQRAKEAVALNKAPAEIVMRPECEWVLKLLFMKFGLGIFTNAAVAYRDAFLQKNPLFKHFQHRCFWSCEMGVYTYSSEAFVIAQKQLQVKEPGEILLLSADKYTVSAARDAGWQAVVVGDFSSALEAMEQQHILA